MVVIERETTQQSIQTKDFIDAPLNQVTPLLQIYNESSLFTCFVHESVNYRDNQISVRNDCQL